MNSIYQKKYMLAQYDEKVYKKYPHSYDASLYDQTSDEPRNDKIRMSYIGHLDDIRTPHLLFKAGLS